MPTQARKGRDATYIVQIEVCPAKMGQNKVADGVGALYGVGVVVERLNEPGILGRYKLAGRDIGPELHHRRQSNWPS